MTTKRANKELEKELQNFPSIYVGLDAHKELLAVAIASPERGGNVHFYDNIQNQQKSINYLFVKIKEQYLSIMACYEAGPSGYNIYHPLTAMDIESIKS